MGRGRTRPLTENELIQNEINAVTRASTQGVQHAYNAVSWSAAFVQAANALGNGANQVEIARANIDTRNTTLKAELLSKVHDAFRDALNTISREPHADGRTADSPAVTRPPSDEAGVEF